MINSSIHHKNILKHSTITFSVVSSSRWLFTINLTFTLFLIFTNNGNNELLELQNNYTLAKTSCMGNKVNQIKPTWISLKEINGLKLENLKKTKWCTSVKRFVSYFKWACSIVSQKLINLWRINLFNLFVAGVELFMIYLARPYYQHYKALF